MEQSFSFAEYLSTSVVTLLMDAVLVGRRNNLPVPGIRPLAVYNPIHYQELSELLMDFVCSLTGRRQTLEQLAQTPQGMAGMRLIHGILDWLSYPN